MSFTIKMARQPFILSTSSISNASRSAFRSVPSRAFHNGKPASSFFTYRATTQPNSIMKFRNAFQQSRTYIQEPVAPRVDSGNLIQKLLVGGAMFGGTLLAINMVFNRETREDGGMPPFERAYLNQTFMHTG